ncbi:alpha-1A adrenergic receptor-like [Stylophora pistillata]|uniref:alpha-1A adrenergic receptor-like n=1 Tax=Stylophora pistillata TaxID=50429 RepID=UPI000C043F01|nr:alpha-1A adrenergic receptor-like [Stylophora pistillata]
MDCDTRGPPTYLSYFSMTISLFLLCITILGNLFVLLAVYQDPHKELRKPFTVLIANLALADLTAGAITEPMAAYFTIQEVRGSVVEDLAVYVTHLSYFMSCTSSVLTLGVLAIDRYLAISYSLWYKSHVTLSLTMKICMAAWIVSMLLSLAYIKIGFINFAFVFANTAVLSTTCVLVFAYYRIFRSLRIRTIQVGILHEGGYQQCERKK